MSKRDKLAHDVVVIKANIDKNELELRSVKITEKEAKTAIDQVEKQIQKLTKERTAVEEKTAVALSDQTTLEKGAQNVLREAQKLRASIQEKEQKMIEIQNEVARIKVDALNTAAHNKELKSTLSECIKELSAKELLITKYEIEIQQRTDEVSKKQLVVDRLNRRFDQLTAGTDEPENAGPLEATIKSLAKDIAQKTQDSSDMQRTWIKGQTELVELQQANDDKQRFISQLHARATVLEQKKVRMLNTASQQNADIKELNTALRTMHHDMGRLNDLIGKNTSLQEDLINQIFHMENDFNDRLKRMQENSEQTERELVTTKAEKTQLL